jgi:MFS family permease
VKCKNRIREGEFTIGYTLKTWVPSYPKESYFLILASLINAVGSAMLWPLTTIYVHNILHRSYGEAGFVLFCQSIASVFGQFTGGSLFHRLGAKKLIVGSLVFAGVAQLTLIVAKDWIPYVAMMTLNGFLSATTMPAVNAFIGFRWKHERYRLFNAVYVCNNAGVAVGTTLAGLLAAVSFNLTFLFDGLTTIGFGVFFFFFLGRMDLGDESELSVGAGLRGESRVWSLMRNYRMYLFLALGTMMISVTTSAWNSGIAPFLNDEGKSPATYSFLWTINGLIILFGQPLISVLNHFVTKSLYGRLISSALFYTIGFGFMLTEHDKYAFLIVGMMICTFGEMLIAPTNPALITQTTGKSAPFYLGVVGGVGNLGRLIAPPLFGSLFDIFGISPILIIAVGMAFCAALLFTIHSGLQKDRYHLLKEIKNTHV